MNKKQKEILQQAIIEHVIVKHFIKYGIKMFEIAPDKIKRIVKPT
tara:strand:- start:300 stop:434 length:135 start_codon:yes stop_codon:yes gene_type:complete